MDKLEELRKIEAKVKEALAELKIELEDFKLTLDEDHADSIRIRIRISPESIMTKDEQMTEEEFKKIIEGL